LLNRYSEGLGNTASFQNLKIVNWQISFVFKCCFFCCFIRQILNQVKCLQLGDFARVEWFDASVGKSMRAGGIYLGVLGGKNKHIILAQNSFRYMHDLSTLIIQQFLQTELGLEQSSPLAWARP